MADRNRALVGRILLFSAGFLGVLALLVWVRVLPADPQMRELFTVGLAICAVAEALVALVLLTRS